MKLFLVSAAAAALILVGPAAFADPPDHHGGKPGDHSGSGSHSGGSHSGGKPGGGKPSGTSHAAPPKAPPHTGSGMGNHTPKTTRDHGMVKTTASPATVYNNAMKNRDNNKNRGNNNRDNHNGNKNYNNNNKHSHSYNNFNRRNVSAQHHYRYRGNSWNWPSGYRYQRWTYGMTLPSIFWARNYWISDYSDYGLAYPPPGTVWVRYGNDAVLIDQYSGNILEVVYGQFY